MDQFYQEITLIRREGDVVIKVWAWGHFGLPQFPSWELGTISPDIHGNIREWRTELLTRSWWINNEWAVCQWRAADGSLGGCSWEELHILSLPITRDLSVFIKTSLPSHCGTHNHNFGWGRFHFYVGTSHLTSINFLLLILGTTPNSVVFCISTQVLSDHWGIFRFSTFKTHPTEQGRWWETGNFLFSLLGPFHWFLIYQCPSWEMDQWDTSKNLRTGCPTCLNLWLSVWLKQSFHKD